MLLRNIRTHYNTYARQESMLGNVGIDSLILNRLLTSRNLVAPLLSMLSRQQSWNIKDTTLTTLVDKCQQFVSLFIFRKVLYFNQCEPVLDILLHGEELMFWEYTGQLVAMSLGTWLTLRPAGQHSREHLNSLHKVSCYQIDYNKHVFCFTVAAIKYVKADNTKM
jgi:hypothetical protein